MSSVYRIESPFFCQKSQGKEVNLSRCTRFLGVVAGGLVVIAGFYILLRSSSVKLNPAVSWSLIASGGSLLIGGLSFKVVREKISVKNDSQVSCVSNSDSKTETSKIKSLSKQDELLARFPEPLLSKLRDISFRENVSISTGVRDLDDYDENLFLFENNSTLYLFVRTNLRYVNLKTDNHDDNYRPKMKMIKHESSRDESTEEIECSFLIMFSNDLKANCLSSAFKCNNKWINGINHRGISLQSFELIEPASSNFDLNVSNPEQLINIENFESLPPKFINRAESKSLWIALRLITKGHFTLPDYNKDIINKANILDESKPQEKIAEKVGSWVFTIINEEEANQDSNDT